LRLFTFALAPRAINSEATWTFLASAAHCSGVLLAFHDPQTGQQPLPQPLKQKMKTKNI